MKRTPKIETLQEVHQEEAQRERIEREYLYWRDIVSKGQGAMNPQVEIAAAILTLVVLLK
jgi:hypothetical protein